MKIHQRCFPNALKSKFGMIKYDFIEYIKYYPDFFFVAETDKKEVIGYAVCYPHWLRGLKDLIAKNHRKSFYIRYFILALFLNKEVWRLFIHKVFVNKEEKRIKCSSTFDNIKGRYIGWGTYLGVFPEYRKTGIAWKLVEQCRMKLKEVGMKAVFFNVKMTNSKVLAFYKCWGCEVIFKGEKYSLLGTSL